MSRKHESEMRRLEVATPVFDLRSLEESRGETWRMVATMMAAPAQPPAGRSGERVAGCRRVARVSLVVVPAVLVSVGVAFAAGAFQTGAPAKTVEQFESPSSSFGTVVASSVRVLPVTAPDPEGGPPRGLRVFETKAGR